MPIVFAQPQPLDAAAAFQAGRQQGQLAAGAAAARQQAVLADYFTAAANRDAAHASQNEDRELRASAGNADRAAMLENAGRNRLFQLQENEQQNQQRQAQMRLHADLQNVELSQTEAVRLQRMRQAVGAVNADDSLAPDEKASLIQQLQTGINPLQQRVAAARVKQEEVQTQMMLGQAQKIAALQSATGATRASLFESQVHRREDGNDYYVDSKGDLRLLEKPTPPKGEKPDPRESPAEMHRLAKLYADREVGLDAHKQVDALGKPTEAARQWQEKYSANLRHQEQVNVERRNAARPDGGVRPEPEPGRTVTQQQRAMLDALPPFDREAPATDKQKALVAGYRSALAGLDARENLDASQKARARDALDQSMQLLVRYRGSTAAMPPDDLKRFQELQQVYEWNATAREAPKKESFGDTVKGVLGTKSPTEGMPGRSAWEKFQDGDLVTLDDVTNLFK